MNRILVAVTCACLSISTGFAGATYSYDSASRLIKADYGAAGVLVYNYDAAGHLVSRQLQPNAPVITSINPSVVPSINANQQITINGSGFQNGTGLTVHVTSGSFHADFTGAQITFVSSSQLVISLNVGTAPANWTIQIINGNGLLSNTLFFTVTAQPATTTMALPQLAYGGGWYTALYFSNTTGSAVQVPVSFMNNDGTPLAVPLNGIGPVSSQTVSLAPGATAILEAPNVGNLVVQGWAEATLPPGVVGYAIFRQSVANRADQEAVVPLIPEDSRSANFSYDETNFTTTFDLLNPSGQQATVTVSVFGADGTPLGSMPVVLAARTKQAETLRALFPAVAGTRGQVSLSANNGAISSLGIKFGGAAFTSIPVTHASQMQTSTTSYAVPQLAFGDGWYTAFYFSNTTTSPVSFPVNFMDFNGGPLSVPLLGIGPVTGQTVHLNAGATVVLEAPNSGSLVQGWAETMLPRGVVGYAIFRQSVVNRFDQEAVVPLTIESSMGADFSYDDTSFTTSIAFLNPSNQQVAVTITIHAADGTQLGSTQVGLTPRSKQSKKLSDLFPNIVGNRGWASFSVTNGDVSVLGLRFGGSAFTTIPVTPR